MVELTIDGIKVEAPEGSMVIQAAHKVGVFVPHFCYHKKLSIAANCRMCLVDVEKAPKALPACATPVTNGMVVHTRSERAVAAQKSVMEFLLINHPLDCPVCDQGGECQLQDLAVGYGGSESRYEEEKRVVHSKTLGPLISTEAMQRCIHCTRCVRFGQEIAGVMEVGMLNRGEHSEITTFVGKSVDSELSGNMIDICPVGALLSRPFKFSARTWEMARRFSVSPHDSLGANLVVQTKMDRVMRVVPFENEDINECWISDRDRFSYEGLHSEDRLAHPMVKGSDGQWREASWTDALRAVTHALSEVREHSGSHQIGAIGSPVATTEELALLARLTRALGSENIDFRLRTLDSELNQSLAGTPWLGMSLPELGALDRVLVVGSFLRKDHPLMAQRLRQAAKAGTQVSFIDSCADNPLLPVTARITTAPDNVANVLVEVLVAALQAAQQPVPAAFAAVQPSAQAQAIAASLASGQKVAVLLGNAVVSSPVAATISANASALAKAVKGRLGFLTQGGNTVGGYLAGAVPAKGGLSAEQMLQQPLKAYIVLHAEPAMDSDNGARAVDTLKSAAFKVALTSYRSAAQDWADVMLPVAPFTETSGTFVNAAGVAQSFKGVAAPYGDTRPAWKVLRVLGNLLELPGFDDETSESVRDAVLASGIQARLSNEVRREPSLVPVTQGIQRVTDVPIFRTDAIVRRAHALQQTNASRPPVAHLSAALAGQLGLGDGDKVKLTSEQGSVTLPYQVDDTVAQGCVRVATAFTETLALGSSTGLLNVERA